MTLAARRRAIGTPEQGTGQSRRVGPEARSAVGVNQVLGSPERSPEWGEAIPIE